MFELLQVFSDFVRSHVWVFAAFAILVLISEALWIMIGGDVRVDEPSEVRKEQLKLRATMFNNLAVAMFTIGVLSPLVGALYNLLPAARFEQIVDLASGWLAAGIAFHFFGAITLRGIR